MDRKSKSEKKTIEEKGQNSLTKFFPKKTTHTNEVVLAERVEELKKMKTERELTEFKEDFLDSCSNYASTIVRVEKIVSMVSHFRQPEESCTSSLLVQN